MSAPHAMRRGALGLRSGSGSGPAGPRPTPCSAADAQQGVQFALLHLDRVGVPWRTSLGAEPTRCRRCGCRRRMGELSHGFDAPLRGGRGPCAGRLRGPAVRPPAAGGSGWSVGLNGSGVALGVVPHSQQCAHAALVSGLSHLGQASRTPRRNQNHPPGPSELFDPPLYTGPGTLLTSSRIGRRGEAEAGRIMRVLVVEDEAVCWADAHRDRGLAPRGDGRGRGLRRGCGLGGAPASTTTGPWWVLDRDLADRPPADEVCRADRRVRARVTRVLMLTAASRRRRTGVAGLSLGADDYLGKPFAFAELVARVRAPRPPGRSPRCPRCWSGRGPAGSTRARRGSEVATGSRSPCHRRSSPCSRC